MQYIVYPLSGMRKEAGIMSGLRSVGNWVANNPGETVALASIPAMVGAWGYGLHRLEKKEKEDPNSAFNTRKRMNEYLNNQIALQNRALGKQASTLEELRKRPGFIGPGSSPEQIQQGMANLQTYMNSRNMSQGERQALTGLANALASGKQVRVPASVMQRLEGKAAPRYIGGPATVRPFGLNMNKSAADVGFMDGLKSGYDEGRNTGRIMGSVQSSILRGDFNRGKQLAEKAGQIQQQAQQNQQQGGFLHGAGKVLGRIGGSLTGHFETGPRFIIM